MREGGGMKEEHYKGIQWGAVGSIKERSIMLVDEWMVQVGLCFTERRGAAQKKREQVRKNRRSSTWRQRR